MRSRDRPICRQPCVQDGPACATDRTPAVRRRTMDVAVVQPPDPFQTTSPTGHTFAHRPAPLGSGRMITSGGRSIRRSLQLIKNSSALLRAGPAGGRPGRSPTPMSLSAAGAAGALTLMRWAQVISTARGAVLPRITYVHCRSSAVVSAPLVAREGFAREGLWCRAARGVVGATTCQDKAKIQILPWCRGQSWFASPACDREPLCGRRGPRYTLSPVLVQAVRDTPRR
jgi:hypothetical protein